MNTPLAPVQPSVPLTSRLLRALRRHLSPRQAWHRTFHRDAEQWTLVQFRDGADNFYHSRHAITCRRCGVSHTQNRLWPKFDADRNCGYRLADAHRLARQISAEPSDSGH